MSTSIERALDKKAKVIEQLAGIDSSGTQEMQEATEYWLQKLAEGKDFDVEDLTRIVSLANVDPGLKSIAAKLLLQRPDTSADERVLAMIIQHVPMKRDECLLLLQTLENEGTVQKGATEIARQAAVLLSPISSLELEPDNFESDANGNTSTREPMYPANFLSDQAKEFHREFDDALALEGGARLEALQSLARSTNGNPRASFWYMAPTVGQSIRLVFLAVQRNDAEMTKNLAELTEKLFENAEATKTDAIA